MSRGYVGWSRSVRSEKAIENFEVPKKMINRDLLSLAIDTAKDRYDLTDQDVTNLEKIPVYVWSMMEPSSWHHTGKYFQKTDHYDLLREAQVFLNYPEVVEAKIVLHRKQIAEKKALIAEEANDYHLYSYGKEIWDGSRNHRKFLRTEFGYGIAFGVNRKLYRIAYLDDKNSLKCEDDLKYYLLGTKSLHIYDSYDNYAELIKSDPTYKNTKRVFNKVYALAKKGNN